MGHVTNYVCSQQLWRNCGKKVVYTCRRIVSNCNFCSSKNINIFVKLTVYEKYRGDIPNISTFHLIRGFDDSGVNIIRSVCFRHLFTPIIYLLHHCEGGMKFYSPREKSYFLRATPQGNIFFLRGISLHVSRRFIQVYYTKRHVIL